MGGCLGIWYPISPAAPYWLRGLTLATTCNVLCYVLAWLLFGAPPIILLLLPWPLQVAALSYAAWKDEESRRSEATEHMD